MSEWQKPVLSISQHSKPEDG